ncbi:MAG TPA: DinB family protein [Candidatus Angelobacter sp.]|nr:DinB family protein [Candidatus Angelobacter sp.]
MSAQPKPATMSADNERLAALLRDSRDHFMATLAGVSDERSRQRPAQGSWSVLDCVEHVAGAETFMLGLLQGPRRPRPDSAPNREAAFFQSVADRSRKVESPERGRPRGRFANLDDARKHFETARADTMRFIQDNTENLRATEVTHPLFGDVSVAEMLVIMAKHVERHARQIEEIKNSPAFLAIMEGRG